MSKLLVCVADIFLCGGYIPNRFPHKGGIYRTSKEIAAGSIKYYQLVGFDKIDNWDADAFVNYEEDYKPCTAIQLACIEMFYLN